VEGAGSTSRTCGSAAARPLAIRNRRPARPEQVVVPHQQVAVLQDPSPTSPAQAESAAFGLVLTVLYQLADFALLPSIVGAEHLVEANGRIAGTQAANEIGGRGLGGLLVQATSAPAAVAVNAVTFLVSALSLRRIRLAPRPAPPADTAPPAAPAAASAWQDTVEGLRVALRHRYIRALLAEATTVNAFNEVFVLGLVLHAVRGLGMSAAELGLAFTASGAGSFAGAWFGARVTDRFGYGRVLLVTLVLGNSAPLALPVADRFGAAPLPVLCAAFVVMGVGIGIANVHAVTLRQVSTAEHLRGRVNAAYRLVSWGAIPVGASAGGFVAAHHGAFTAMTAGAAGIASATLWVALSAVPRLRRIEDAAADQPPTARGTA
jgi:hypothetical protein